MKATHIVDEILLTYETKSALHMVPSLSPRLVASEARQQFHQRHQVAQPEVGTAPGELVEGIRRGCARPAPRHRERAPVGRRQPDAVAVVAALLTGLREGLARQGVEGVGDPDLE